MDPGVGLLLALLLVLANALFVAAQVAIVKVARGRPERPEGQEPSRGRLGRRIARRIDAYLAATRLGVTIASLGLGWLGGPAIAALLAPALRGVGAGAWADLLGVVVSFTVIVILHLTLGQLVPAAVAGALPDRTTQVTAVPLHAFFVITRPLVAVGNGLAGVLLRIAGFRTGVADDAAQTEHGLGVLLTASAAQGVLDPMESELARRSLTLGELAVRDLMVPRVRLGAISVALDRESAKAALVDLGHARVPVYDGSLDNIVGMLDWTALFGATDRRWQDSIETVLMIPESLDASAALDRMRSVPAPEAVVVDEYGGTAGFLTLSALLGVLTARRPTVTLPATVPGDSPIHLVERDLAITFPRSEASTLAGFILERLGQLPKPGDSVDVGTVRFTVERVARRRIERVRVESAIALSLPTTR